MKYKWLLFCPQLPATPSSPRVMVWRKMHTAGALGLDNGIWILPYNATSEQFVQEMKAYVESQGGNSKNFIADALDEQTEQEIIKRFNLDRAREYEEFKEKCLDFLAEIEHEIARKNFSFAEYEENEQDFAKLKTWLAKVRQRDFIGEEHARDAEDWLDKCQQALNRFAETVFDHEKQE